MTFGKVYSTEWDTKETNKLSSSLSTRCSERSIKGFGNGILKSYSGILIYVRENIHME